MRTSPPMRTSPNREMPDASGPEIEDVVMCECPICSRKFREQIFDKHVARCKINKNKKARKKFKVSVISDDELLRQGVDKKTQSRRVKKEAKRLADKKGKPGKWRQQSSQIRAIANIDNPNASAAQRGAGEYSGAGAPPAFEAADDRTPCPHCSRKFAAETAVRHIPMCAKRHQDKAMNKRAVRGSGAKGVRDLKNKNARGSRRGR